MPESTLSLQLSDLAARVGHYLGYGRDQTAWTGWSALTPYVPVAVGTVGQAGYVAPGNTQLADVMECVSAGLRQFYFPPKLGNDPVAHKWSFLTPDGVLVTNSGQQVYDMPDDFASFDGELTYDPTAGVFVTVRRVGEGRIRELTQQSQGLTGKPEKIAVVPKKSDGVMGQRFQATLWPIPDAAYNLTYRYNVLPGALTAANPFPYGGMAHAETILESCLAVAESRINEDTAGTHQKAFLDRLAASIAVDVRDYRPENLGYNGDTSDGRGRMPFNWREAFDNSVTYRGVLYTS